MALLAARPTGHQRAPRLRLLLDRHRNPPRLHAARGTAALGSMITLVVSLLAMASAVGSERSGPAPVSVVTRARKVERRVAIEEPVGHQLETGLGHRHDRPLLDPGHMVGPDHIPNHDISAFDATVGARPPRQAVRPRVLPWVVACGIPLFGIVRSHPQVLGGEQGSATHRGVVMHEGTDVGAWEQAI